MPYSTGNLQDHLGSIRDLINKPRTQYNLLKNKSLWFQLCSSLDVVGDTELAVASYEAGDFGASDGARYLTVYGVLQALFVQQDAVLNLCEALEMVLTVDNYPRLKEIREIRTESIGHPTRKGRGRKGQPTSYHFIVRMTLKPGGFSLLSEYSDGRSDYRDVSISQLIREQNSCISEILTSLIRELEREEVAHKEKFKMEKLEAVLGDTLDYHLGKVLQATIDADPAQSAGPDLRQITKALQAFREALGRRGIELDTYDSIKYAYERLEYPLTMLEGFFRRVRGQQKRSINKETAYIFAWFVRGQVAEPREMAREIDSDYSS